MSNLRFTIVTCTYNAEATLQRTLDSILAQQVPLQHLLIDGTSTDGTLGLMQSYIERSRVEAPSHDIIRRSEPDQGLYDAMNKALPMATGDYILYLNAGDTLATGTTLADIASDIGTAETLPAVIYGDTLIIDCQGHILRQRRLRPPMELTSKSFRQGMLVCHQAFYARTDLACECRYDLQYRYSADVDWCIRVMKRGEEQHLACYNTHRVLAHYLDEGLTTANRRASLCERFRIMRHHYGLPTTVLMHLWFAVRALIKR